MKRIRESLEYPIPFWLSPIFLLSLIGFWMIFKWGFESTPEKWEYWKWVIERIVYIVTVVGAAYWAQRIFNNNARDRENRERRLKNIESMVADMLSMHHELMDLIWSPTDIYSQGKKIATFHESISVSSELYFPEILTAILEFRKKFDSLFDRYTAELISYNSKQVQRNVGVPLPDEPKPGFTTILDSIEVDNFMIVYQETKDLIIETHRKYENS